MNEKSYQRDDLPVEGDFSIQGLPGDLDRPIGVDAIDRVGVSRIAGRLEISEQAVRRWRQKGKIPVDRHDDLRGLLRECSDEVSITRQVAEVAGVSDLVDVVSVSPIAETCRGGREVDREASHQSLIVKPTGRPSLADINGRSARRSIELLIAARNVDQAKAVVEKTAAAAEGMPPVAPVRGYKLRLATLFALDFPILTMAFASVTEASPIVAAGSAIALSLGLVLCAHAAGAQLRGLADHIPTWLQNATTLLLMVALIAAVIAVATELRLKGYALDDALLERGSAGLFGPDGGSTGGLPETFTSAIVRAAGLVTLLLTIFGISWSYQNHGPQRDFASAEKSYRRALRRYARAITKIGKTSLSVPILVAFSVVAIMPVHSAHASSCNGKSVLALIDTTTPYDHQDRQQIMPAIDEMVRSLVPGSRLVIRTIRDAPSTSRLLLDECVPGPSTFEFSLPGIWAWLSASPGDARTAQEGFRKAVRDTLLPQLNQQGDADGTALIDTIAHFSGGSGPSDIWLFSDLLESVAIPTSSLLASSDSLIKLARNDLALSNFNVHVAGVGRFHDPNRRPLTPSEFGSLIDAWAAFIRQSGGEIHVFEEHRSINSNMRDKR